MTHSFSITHQSKHHNLTSKHCQTQQVQTLCWAYFFTNLKENRLQYFTKYRQHLVIHLAEGFKFFDLYHPLLSFSIIVDQKRKAKILLGKTMHACGIARFFFSSNDRVTSRALSFSKTLRPGAVAQTCNPSYQWG